MSTQQDNPIFHDAPADSARVQVRVVGEAHGPPVRFFLYRDVLEELLYAARWRDESFMWGVLSGAFGIDDEGPFIEVTGFEGLTYMPRLDDCIEGLQETVQQHFIEGRTVAQDAHESPVGMVMSAPGGGARLHREAMRAHLSLFNVPFQLLLMVDPAQERLAAYSRQPKGAFFNAALRVVEARDADGSGADVVDRDGLSMPEPSSHTSAPSPAASGAEEE